MFSVHYFLGGTVFTKLHFQLGYNFCSACYLIFLLCHQFIRFVYAKSSLVGNAEANTPNPSPGLTSIKRPI